MHPGCLFSVLVKPLATKLLTPLGKVKCIRLFTLLLSNEDGTTSTSMESTISESVQ